MVLLDASSRVHRFVYNKNSEGLVKTSELKFLEKVQTMMSANKCIFRRAVLTSEGMYIGPFHFRYLKKQATIKDPEYQLE